ncbi:hypothetical protein ACFQ1L_15700 [Phytohabitans flavus]|uniref:Uncharacterized protein n=1 Tax=Phytohabitans flavus TaxID=1076124 RepID=A0A6F8XX57_9ACTN|nr:hypothetical protein [Phytohabitans flavus]BCB78377.1 hypothetical protein Pflav_047870 [Phytohabitans flavus]
MDSRVERAAGGAIVVPQMNAVALDRFGGVDELSSRRVPLPEVGDDDVLIRVEFAGVASWDAFEREGATTAFSASRRPSPMFLAGTRRARWPRSDAMSLGSMWVIVSTLRRCR